MPSDELDMPRPRSIWPALLAVLLPGVIAAAILLRQTLVVPYGDDYNAVLIFSLHYERLTGALARLLYIAAAQHNEYKLPFEHAVVAAQLEIWHRVNFAWLSGMGDLLLLPIAWMLWLIERRNGAKDLRTRLWMFVPVSLIFFSISYWETLNWAVALQNIGVASFAVVALWCVAARPGEDVGALRFAWGCVAAFISATCSANGFLLGFVGLVLLLSRRQWLRAAGWCASFVLPLAAYLYRYTVLAHPAGQLGVVNRGLFFLSFLGCVVPWLPGAIVLGAVLLGGLGMAVKTRFDRVNPAGAAIALWCLLTAALATIVRGGHALQTSSRYSIYSTLLVIFCYGFAAQWVATRWSEVAARRLYVAVVVVFGLFWLASDRRAYKILGQRKVSILAAMETYQADPARNTPLPIMGFESETPAEEMLERVTLTEAIRVGVYSPPAPAGSK